MTEIYELTNSEFNLFIKKGVVLIDFFSEGCMPCMMMTPIIEDLQKEFENKAKIARVNIEENIDLAKRYNVNTIPHFVLLKEGKVLESSSGLMNEEELTNLIEKHL